MATPSSFELMPPPFPEADTPSFEPIKVIPLPPDMRPKDLSIIRRQVVLAVTGRSTVDPELLAYIAGELVADAADLNAEGLAEDQRALGIDVPPQMLAPEELRRHAESVTIGHTTNGGIGRIVLGVTDDMPFWLRSPLRPMAAEDDDLGGITGRGIRSIKELVYSATVTTCPEGKTVWVELDEPHAA
jgi:hypothetical protein